LADGAVGDELLLGHLGTTRQMISNSAS
jgi:hypothetical protein